MSQLKSIISQLEEILRSLKSLEGIPLETIKEDNLDSFLTKSEVLDCILQGVSIKHEGNEMFNVAGDYVKSLCVLERLPDIKYWKSVKSTGGIPAVRFASKLPQEDIIQGIKILTDEKVNQMKFSKYNYGEIPPL